MARLPNAENAIIAREKIVSYLLSFDHPQGRGKAAFFSSFGFTLSRWYDLKSALLDQAGSCEVRQTVDNVFGRKYTIEGPLKAPYGRLPVVRSIWFIAKASDAPVFVTAFPGKDAHD